MGGVQIEIHLPRRDAVALCLVGDVGHDLVRLWIADVGYECVRGSAGSVVMISAGL
jgi:hypothetical protein